MTESFETAATSRRRSIAGVNKKENIDIFDTLPQPFRMVTKLIEKEILDAAWLEILRKHPDLQVDSNGEQITLSRNHKLSESFPTSKTRELSHHITGIVETNGLMCSVDSTGAFSVKSGDKYERILSEDLFDAPSDVAIADIAATAATTTTPSAAAATAVDTTKPLSTPLSHLLIGPSVSMLKVAAERDSSLFSFHSRVVVYGLVVASEPKPLPEGGKKAPAAKAPINPEDSEDKVAKYRIVVVDVRRVVNFAGHPQLSIKRVCELTADKIPLGPAVDLQRLLYEDVSLSLSVDGLMLSVTSSGPSGGCRLYSLPSAAPLLNDGDTIEHTAAEGAAETAVAAASLPVLLAHLDVNSSVLKGYKPQHVIIIPQPVPELTAIATYVLLPPVASSASLRGSVTANKQPNSARPNSGRPPSASRTTAGVAGGPSRGALASAPDVVDIEKVTIAVLSRGAPYWMIFGLRDRSKDAKPVETVDPKAKKATAAEVAAPVAPLFNYDLYVVAEWRLSSRITAHATDTRHDLVAFGQSDGEVSLWNLGDRSMINILGRHKAAVSALHLTVEDDFSQYYLTSGSVDGTICFFSTEQNPNEQNRLGLTMTAANVANGKKKRNIGSMELKDFRSDMATSSGVKCDALVQFQSSDNKLSAFPLIFAQYTSGAVLLYDFKSRALIGKLDGTERQGFTTSTYYPMTHNALPEITLPEKSKADDATATATTGAESANAVRKQSINTISAASAVLSGVLLGKAISSASSSHFHCVYSRNETPTVFSFSLAAIMKQYAAHSAAHSAFENTNTAGKETAAVLEGGSSVSSTRKSSMTKHGTGQLRLTEERLHALELSFHAANGSNSHYSSTAGVAQPKIEVKRPELNPRKVIQKDVLKSKIEREARKARLTSTLNELGSFL